MFDEENIFLLKDERQADVGFSGKKFFFVVTLRNSGLTTLHVPDVWLEKMAVWKGRRPLSGLVW